MVTKKLNLTPYLKLLWKKKKNPKQNKIKKNKTIMSIVLVLVQ